MQEITNSRARKSKRSYPWNWLNSPLSEDDTEVIMKLPAVSGARYTYEFMFLAYHNLSGIQLPYFP